MSRMPAAIIGAVVLVMTACTNAKLDESPNANPTTTAATAFADPNSTGAGPILSGASPIKGMRGVTPGIRIDDDFRDRIGEIDPSVTDLPAAAEGYDVVTVIALATEAARTDMPGRIADGIIAATEGGHSCVTFARCRSLALQNQDYDYNGVSGNIELLGNGDPGEAGFAVVQFDGTGAVRAGEQVEAQAKALATTPVAADPTYGPPGDGVLTIGTLLPVTGPDDLAARGALAGVKLATADINDRGGVLGDPIVLLPDESGDGSPTATVDAAQKLIDQHADAIVGGTSYAVTSAALSTVVDAGLVLFSPTDTARALAVAPDRGLFFRVAPSTELEGQVLGQLVTDDGFTSAAIISGPDDDDRELASDVAASLNSASASITVNVDVGVNSDLGDAARRALASSPQALILATPPDVTATLLKALIADGKGPTQLATYGTAANMTPTLAKTIGG